MQSIPENSINFVKNLVLSVAFCHYNWYNTANENN